MNIKRAVILLIGALCVHCGVACAGDADTSKHGYLVLEAPRTTVYINERAPMILSYYSDSSCLGDIPGCKIKSEDLIIEDFLSTENSVVERDGKRYDLTVCRAMFTAQTAGRFMVKPVKMRVDVVEYKKDGSSGGSDKEDIYRMLEAIRKRSQLIKDKVTQDQSVEPAGKGSSIELSTEPLYITVIPLPKEGRPEDFTGAVGDFSFDLSASAAEARVGEDIALNMIIKGPGNYNTVRAPAIKDTAGIKQYQAHAVRGQDSVNYEQALRIRSAAVREIPAVTFSFFSPAEQRYISLTKGPIPIRVTGVAPGAAATAGKTPEPEEKKEWVDSLKNPVYPLRERSAPFYRGKAFLLFETLPVLIVMAGLLAYTIVRYLETHPLYKASFAASRRARRDLIKAESMLGRKSPGEFYEFIFRILQGYLGARRLKPSGGITGNIIEEFDMRGIDEGTIKKVREIFYECYVAIYTEGVLGKDDMRDTLNSLTRVIGDLDKKAEL